MRCGAGVVWTPILLSCAVLTRLRGRSRFGEAKARASILFKRSCEEDRWRGHNGCLSAQLHGAAVGLVVPRSRYFASFTAMTSISTRNPGLASEATPTTERAGRLGCAPPKHCV